MRLLFLICTILSFACSNNSLLGIRHYEVKGGFSFCAPKNWKFSNFTGLKFKIAKGGATNSIHGNLNVVEDSVTSDIKSYVDSEIVKAKDTYVHYDLIDRKSIQTTSGILGECFIIKRSTSPNNFLRHTFFVFKGNKNKYLVVTYTCLEKYGDDLKNIFEESIKTFELER